MPKLLANKITTRIGLLLLVVIVVCLLPTAIALAAADDVFDNKMQSAMYYMFIGLGGTILSYAGVLFDMVMDELVIGMGKFLTGNSATLSGSGSIITAINTVWEIVRDFFNILFIFGLIYIGFKTILGTDEAGTRRWLISLIGAALLINFSLYFTQVIIDFSNVTAQQIDSLITVTDTNGDEAGMSQLLMQYAKLETFADPNNTVVTDSIATDGENGSWRVVMFGFMMMIFMLVTAFVLAAGAIMMLIRFFILILCMMFSPAMFLGWIYPGMSRFTSMWVKTLLQNAFLAPAYLFMLYISVMVMERMTTSGSFAAAFTDLSSSTGSFVVVFQFALVIGLMIMALLVAKEMGGVGATQSISIGNSIRRQTLGYAGRAAGRAAGGATFGSVARLGRVGAGSAGAAVTGSSRVRTLAEKKGLSGWAGRQALLAGDKVSEASFDARRIGGIGKKVGIGEGKKGGFKQDLKDKEKRETKIAGMLGESEQVYTDLQVKKQHNEYKDFVKKRNEAIAELSRTTDADRKQILTQSISALGEEIKTIEDAYKKDKIPDRVQAKIDDTNIAFTKDDWDQMKKYSATRKLAQSLPKEKYAVNLENRWTLTDGGTDLNKAAAKAIRKDLKKGDNDKLVDAIKSSGSNTST